ncbi:MAG: hypothetical protein DSM107014_15420 [Gomphosphaeria aponina SAG 52.96 = DSM 107014]|uniref:Uncharacterized protein n=1 Tax=Gomphosphaeria aponina SAG 52.96 = DSM 107014 TaxID=1521640 RepID=A0A941GV51_9CHRO|nr:hypothetical protein [Gomphosphaeria aponina SAG 52.96 = DSM 107014]
MFYTFDIIGVAPVLNFFYYQQQLEINPQRSKAYLGSYQCSLDSLIQSTELIPQKPNWEWDRVIDTIVKFWLTHEESIRNWKHELETLGEENLLVARVANVESLRTEFESLLE